MLPEAAKFKKDWQSAQKTLREGGKDCAFVYVHIEADTGNPFYVGIGKLSNRPWSKKNRSNYHKNKSNKHGLLVNIIADQLSWEKACFWETRWISVLKSAGYELVNLTDGGEGASGFYHSDEFKSRKSKSMKDSWEDNPQKRAELSLRMSGDANPSKDPLIRSEKCGENNPSKRPEVRKKISENLKALGNDHPMKRPECKEKVSGENSHMKRPGVRKAHTDAMKNMPKEKRINRVLKGWEKRYKRYQYWGA